MAVASAGADAKAYMPMKLPSSMKAYIKAMVVGLEVADAILPSLLCTNPMLPIVATLSVFKAMMDRKSMAPEAKEYINKVGD